MTKNRLLVFVTKNRFLVFAIALYPIVVFACLRILIYKIDLDLDLTFNSMIEHLMRGEFDVDANIIGDEGLRRGSHVYAYFGIFCAVIRAPLMLIPGGLRFDVTLLSCLLAVIGAAAIKLKTLGVVYRATRPSPLRETLYWALALSVLFGGAQIQFLRPSVYQEVCFWAGLLAAGFVYFAVCGVVADAFKTSALCFMATLAGLALLTRVSVGLGLYAALGLLLLTTLHRELETNSEGVAPRRPLHTRLMSGGIAWPALVLLAFVIVTAWINYGRWGNPFAFTGSDYIMLERYPDRAPRMAAYGVFNVTRIPFGLVYYFFPIWLVRRPDGFLLFEEHQQRLIDAAELPASSFLLTDPLLLLLSAVLIGSFFVGRRGDPALDRLRTLAIMLGLSVPCALMLTFISMNFRYRMEFYPLMEFGAFAGFRTLCRSDLSTAAANWMRGVSVALAALGIFSSSASLALYKVSDFGPSTHLLRAGVFNYYEGEFDKVYKKHLRRFATHWGI
jgi:hypothetical protein